MPLHEWANSRHRELLLFLVEQLDTHHIPKAGKFLEHLLEAGDGLLLFDGLDEVRQGRAQRAETARKLRNFTDVINSTTNRIFVFDSEIAYALADALSFEVAVDFAIYYARSITKILAHIPSFTKEHSEFISGFPRLVELLDKMGVPSIAAEISQSQPIDGRDIGQWQMFSQNVQNIMESKRNLYPPRQLLEEDYPQINSFLYVNELLVRCLDLAYVSNRQEILDNLLRPPSPPPSS